MEGTPPSLQSWRPRSAGSQQPPAWCTLPGTCQPGGPGGAQAGLPPRPVLPALCPAPASAGTGRCGHHRAPALPPASVSRHPGSAAAAQRAGRWRSGRGRALVLPSQPPVPPLPCAPGPAAAAQHRPVTAERAQWQWGAQGGCRGWDGESHSHLYADGEAVDTGCLEASEALCGGGAGVGFQRDLGTSREMGSPCHSLQHHCDGDRAGQAGGAATEEH